MKEEITSLTQGADRLLDRTENPLHRQILENYRRHALLEVTGRWREVVYDPAMTVEHPVYHYLGPDGSSVTLDGRQQVADFYDTMARQRATVATVHDEELAVADWGFASEATYHLYLPPESGPDDGDGGPRTTCIRRQRIAMHWRYDADARLLEEHHYEHPGRAEIIEIPSRDFITPEDAVAALSPLIRPLRDFIRPGGPGSC
ncbi:hypothetical protein ACIPLC_27435 [Kitasatospora sp. NPDC086801]|uniref:hypothetical protein n=1 Tax=Kitasatospora sp. NPDC086801 TaxID=3364066 RepID=UPI0037F8603D